ncbi:M14 family metallopeptidase [Celerinatantimonas yamalensis]|uniref:M14 family metallocarboxypeptidase n=1 Tax=Celerinatantimonas yamalensis TaxID=559956 RepID=A0ABW9G2B0_9GAMM
MSSSYPIGQAGTPWGVAEIAAWRSAQVKQRSYNNEVISKIDQLPESCVIEQYGELNYAEHYPLLAIKSAIWQRNRPTILITGGVHGYETSGVQGALCFAREHISDYQQHVNIIITPCVSPWGYEHIQRWNPEAIDPNRSFYQDSPVPESAQLMAYIQAQDEPIWFHIDLHETTDSDEQEFRPALAAKQGKPYEADSIPDGFYLVADSAKPTLEFQRAIIDSVAKVTHIAPSDDQGLIIGEKVVQPGVILYPMAKLGLCGSLSDCQFHATTEVYPDSPKATPSQCNKAQVAAILGGLNYVLAQR